MEPRENEVVYLHLDDIIPNRFQPRQIFDEKALKELAVSIKEHGVIQPIIVRNIGNKYEIIAGERRYKASALAGLTKIPAIIRNLDDKESSKVALLENLQRKNLNPIEEAKTYRKILELDDMTQEELAKTMGKSQSAVANKLRLLSLTDEVQDALLKDQISERHARALLSVPDKETQKKLLREIIDKKMTVRELEEKIKPKEEVTPEDINEILNPPSVSAQEPTINQNNNFNQSIGIDYSTPPKFIDYDTPNISENLESTANKPIDIDAIKANAKEIDITPPQTVKEVTKEPTNNFEPPQPTPGPSGNFKFFSPPEDEKTTKPQNEQIPSTESTSTSLFSNVPPATPTTDFNKVDPFSYGTETKKLDDTTSTSMDKLLAGVENNNQPATTTIPPVDTFNNPFAHNPIFQDNVIQEENNKIKQKPRYTLNESINLVRETTKEIENSGFNVDVEEMNFANTYQIVIKISKEQKQEEK